MTLAVAILLGGILLIYAGIKGQSIRALIIGKVEPSQRPQAAR